MLHVDHSRHAQSPGSSLPGTRVAAHGKRAAPLLARFLLTAQGAGASGLFSQPRVRHGAVNDVEWEVMTIIPTIVQTQHNVLTAEKTICQDPVTVKFGKKKKKS